jgi:hypothetical protein
MSGAKWCCHPTRHPGARRMGPEGPDKHRKGKYRLSFELASHISNVYSTADSARMIDVASDLLCTTCFNVEMSRMNADTSANRMKTDDNQSSKMRAAAIAAGARISNQIQIDHANLGVSIQYDSPDDMDDETIRIETSERRGQSISLLNDVFVLLGVKHIEDVRNQNILRDQTNKALLAIRRLAESISDSGDRQAPSDRLTSEYTLDEADELITGFKHLVDSSDYTEQIRLLTLAPSGWGRAKMESFFNCSQRQARYAVYLRDSGRKLHCPIDLRGNMPFDPQIETQILEFYHDDVISRVRNTQ